MSRKKLRILFDANPLVNGNKSGVGYYTQGLIQALAENYPDDIELIGHYFSFLGRKDSVLLPAAKNIRYKKSRILPGKALSVTRKFGFQLPLELLFKQRGDVALFTNFVSLPSLTGIPTLVAIHDLCFEDVPHYVAEKNRKFLQKFVPKSVKSAAKIITISKSTKTAIVNRYQVASEKIIITPIPPPDNNLEGYIKPKSVKGKFILFVSTLEPRKNVIGLVKAYEALPEKTKNKYSLILAGGIGWYMDETIRYIKQSQEKGNQIILLGYISDQEKRWLYKNASLFVLPSHYEGFGMPILEAMQYDIPTLVSDIEVFHEVSGDASIYFNKDEPVSISNAIQSTITNPALKRALISKATKHLERYDWKTVTADVYATFFDVIRR